MGAKDIIADEDVAANLSHSFTSLSLTECSAIYATVHTYSASGVDGSDLVGANFFYYDNTAPSDPSSLGFLSYYVAGTGPTLAWAGSTDNRTSNIHYMVALGTASGDDSIEAWTTTSLTSHSFNSLSLTVGDTVFMSVKAVDEAGHESNVAMSFVVPDAPDAPNLGSTSIGIEEVSLGWAEPEDNDRPITDYVVEYKESSSSSWTVFNDGTSTDQVLTITGLSESTEYDFRAYASNGEDSQYSDTLTLTTQINDPFFDNTTYKSMNIGGATSSRMVALEDGTTVTMADGTTTVSLNKGDTHSFSSTIGDVIESDKPVFIAGKNATGTSNVTKANVVWSSPDWAGREFMFNVSRYAPHELYVYMFDAGTLDVTEGSGSPTSYSFAAGEHKTITLTSNTNYYISSDQPALAYLISVNTSELTDQIQNRYYRVVQILLASHLILQRFL